MSFKAFSDPKYQNESPQFLPDDHKIMCTVDYVYKMILLHLTSPVGKLFEETYEGYIEDGYIDFPKKRHALWNLLKKHERLTITRRQEVEASKASAKWYKQHGLNKQLKQPEELRRSIVGKREGLFDIAEQLRFEAAYSPEEYAP